MIRAISILLAFTALTLVLLPIQLAGLIFGLRLQRVRPPGYHRILCALIGVRIHELGARSARCITRSGIRSTATSPCSRCRWPTSA